MSRIEKDKEEIAENLQDLYPLTSAQEVVLLDQMMNFDSPHYNIGFALALEGDIDSKVLSQAAQYSAERFDALRLVLRNNDGEIKQKFLSAVTIVQEELSFIDDPDGEIKAKEYIRAEAGRAFDLFSGLLWKVVLIRISEKRCYWVFRFHHIFIDGIAAILVLESLLTTCNHLAQPARFLLPVKGVSYLEYIANDRAYRDSPRFHRDRIFWCDYINSIPPSIVEQIAAGSEFRRPPTQENHLISSRITTWAIERSDYEKMEGVVNDVGCTFSHFAIALVCSYFARINDLEHVVIGLAIHNRPNAKFKKTVGMFSSIVPVRIPVGREQPFSVLVQRVRTELAQVYRHRRYSIAELNRHLKLGASGRQQLFDVIVSFEDFSVDHPFELGSYHFQRIDSGYETTPLSITIRDYHDEENVQFSLEYNTAKFSESDIETIKERFSAFVNTILAEPGVTVAQLPVASDWEIRRQLTEFSGPTRKYAGAPSLHGRFEAQVVRNPEAEAVVDGNRRL
ncbi:MAG: condensation domain-containing protein, partial [Proteobacteria bacterium]|nr:condensation domain-containing protein [Pseudomonadota bacterium]